MVEKILKNEEMKNMKIEESEYKFNILRERERRRDEEI
jgi:hypothetical protein